MVLRWHLWCSSGTHGSSVVLMVLQWYSWFFGGAYGALVVLIGSPVVLRVLPCVLLVFSWCCCFFGFIGTKFWSYFGTGS